MKIQPIDIKGEMNMQNVLHVHSTDVREILHALTEKRDEAPQFFLHSPIIVDCKSLDDECTDLDYKGLLTGLRALSFVPVGIRHLPSDSVDSAMQAGWAILRDSTAKQSQLKTEPNIKKDTSQSEEVADNDTNTNTEVAYSGERVKVITRPVRSGQQVYAAQGDIVVLSQTGAGSEVLADGSIHVYGSIAGRVLAGVNGDRSARIFCQGLEAELISIAGVYQLLDEIDTPLKGQPAMIHLEGGKLLIEPMV